MKIFVGNHTEERPEHVVQNFIEFVDQCFKMKRVYMSLKGAQPKKTEFSIFDQPSQTSIINYPVDNI